MILLNHPAVFFYTKTYDLGNIDKRIAALENSNQYFEAIEEFEDELRKYSPSQVASVFFSKLMSFLKRVNAHVGALLSNNKYQQAIRIMNKVKPLSKYIQSDLTGYADFLNALLNTMAYAYKATEQYALALNCLNEALLVCEKTGQNTHLANTYLNMCSVWCLLSDYKQARANAVKAVDFIIKSKPENDNVHERNAQLGYAYYNIGMQDEYLGNNNKALELYEKASLLLQNNPCANPEMIETVKNAMTNLQEKIVADLSDSRSGYSEISHKSNVSSVSEKQSAKTELKYQVMPYKQSSSMLRNSYKSNTGKQKQLVIAKANFSQGFSKSKHVPANNFMRGSVEVNKTDGFIDPKHKKTKGIPIWDKVFLQSMGIEKGKNKAISNEENEEYAEVKFLRKLGLMDWSDADAKKGMIRVYNVKTVRKHAKDHKKNTLHDLSEKLKQLADESESGGEIVPKFQEFMNELRETIKKEGLNVGMDYTGNMSEAIAGTSNKNENELQKLKRTDTEPKLSATMIPATAKNKRKKLVDEYRMKIFENREKAKTSTQSPEKFPKEKTGTIQPKEELKRITKKYEESESEANSASPNKSKSPTPANEFNNYAESSAKETESPIMKNNSKPPATKKHFSSKEDEKVEIDEVNNQEENETTQHQTIDMNEKPHPITNYKQGVKDMKSKKNKNEDKGKTQATPQLDVLDHDSKPDNNTVEAELIKNEENKKSEKESTQEKLDKKERHAESIESTNFKETVATKGTNEKSGTNVYRESENLGENNILIQEEDQNRPVDIVVQKMYTPDMNQAAIKIQKNYRGYAARSKYRVKKTGRSNAQIVQKQHKRILVVRAFYKIKNGPTYQIAIFLSNENVLEITAMDHKTKDTVFRKYHTLTSKYSKEFLMQCWDQTLEKSAGSIEHDFASFCKKITEPKKTEIKPSEIPKSDSSRQSIEKQDKLAKSETHQESPKPKPKIPEKLTESTKKESPKTNQKTPEKHSESIKIDSSKIIKKSLEKHDESIKEDSLAKKTSEKLNESIKNSSSRISQKTTEKQAAPIINEPAKNIPRTSEKQTDSAQPTDRPIECSLSEIRQKPPEEPKPVLAESAKQQLKKQKSIVPPINLSGDKQYTDQDKHKNASRIQKWFKRRLAFRKKQSGPQTKILHQSAAKLPLFKGDEKESSETVFANLRFILDIPMNRVRILARNAQKKAYITVKFILATQNLENIKFVISHLFVKSNGNEQILNYDNDPALPALIEKITDSPAARPPGLFNSIHKENTINLSPTNSAIRSPSPTPQFLAPSTLSKFNFANKSNKSPGVEVTDVAPNEEERIRRMSNASQLLEETEREVRNGTENPVFSLFRMQAAKTLVQATIDKADNRVKIEDKPETFTKALNISGRMTIIKAFFHPETSDRNLKIAVYDYEKRSTQNFLIENFHCIDLSLDERITKFLKIFSNIEYNYTTQTYCFAISKEPMHDTSILGVKDLDNDKGMTGRSKFAKQVTQNLDDRKHVIFEVTRKIQDSYWRISIFLNEEGTIVITACNTEQQDNVVSQILKVNGATFIRSVRSDDAENQLGKIICNWMTFDPSVEKFNVNEARIEDILNDTIMSQKYNSLVRLQGRMRTCLARQMIHEAVELKKKESAVIVAFGMKMGFTYHYIKVIKSNTCNNLIIKSDHAQNHIEIPIPEFLPQYPDYNAETRYQFLIDVKAKLYRILAYNRKTKQIILAEPQTSVLQSKTASKIKHN